MGPLCCTLNWIGSLVWKKLGICTAHGIGIVSLKGKFKGSEAKEVRNGETQLPHKNSPFCILPFFLPFNHIYLSASLSLSICLSISLHVSNYLSLSTNLSIISICFHESLSPYHHLSNYQSLSLFFFLSLSLSLSTSQYLSVYLYIWSYLSLS